VISRLTIRIDDSPNAAARAWAARLLAYICGFPFRLEIVPPEVSHHRGPLLYYGRRTGLPGITVQQSEFFDRPLTRPFKAPAEPTAEIEGLPIVFGTNFAARSKGRVAFGADFFASAFFLASRIEERFAGDRDRHGRLPAGSSFLGRNGLLERPLVDEYARFLAAEIIRAYPTLMRRYPWPVTARFAACITHDIETIKAPSRLGYLKARMFSAGPAAAKGDLAKNTEAAAAIIRALSGDNPTWSFDGLREPVRPWPATFFFFGGATNPLDGAYDVGSAQIRGMLEALSADGCEIGVHLGYDTASDEGLMKAQAGKVASASGRPVRGARHHYLRAAFPDVWKAHEKAGFAYDASLGFSEAAGFRAGTSYPFRPFDVDSGRPLTVVALPLVAMDATFFQYRRMTGEETAGHALSLAETAARAGGVFTLLWRNTAADLADRAGPARAYSLITAGLKKMQAWGATGGECIDAWRLYCGSLEEKRG